MFVCKMQQNVIKLSFHNMKYDLSLIPIPIVARTPLSVACFCTMPRHTMIYSGHRLDNDIAKKLLCSIYKL